MVTEFPIYFNTLESYCVQMFHIISYLVLYLKQHSILLNIILKHIVMYMFLLFESVLGTPLVAQWLRHHTPDVGDLGSTPGWGTRSHMLQLRPSTAK